MLKRLYRPPFVGLLAFLAVFAVQPLGHAIMILMEILFEHLGLQGAYYSYFHNGVTPTIPEGYGDYSVIRPHIYWTAFAMGAVGLGIIYWGVRKNEEIFGTWAGFIGASLLWTGWVEFTLHFYARLFAVPALCDNGMAAFACAENPATKPEYMIMQGTLGFLLVIMVFFVFNKESRCNMFRWMHRNFKMKVGEPTQGLKRNFSNIVAIETITILWFFYVYLMVIYEIGEQSWIVYASFVGFMVWGLYLFVRLMRFSRVTVALRYAIPTAIICWNVNEILGRWGMYKEFWIHPLEYKLEVTLVLVALILFTVISIKTAKDKKRPMEEPAE